MVTTNRNLSAYDAPPGDYTVKLTIGDFQQTQSFNINIDPRILSSIPNVESAYVERDQISKTILAGATEMAKGVRDLRLVKEQLTFILKVTTDKALISDGNNLNKILDDWIAKILQKELRTGQHNYQFEARLLVKYKNFLNSISKGNLPVTQGMKDVSRDYLIKWNDYAQALKNIKAQEIKNYNILLKNAGLPEIYWP